MGKHERQARRAAAARRAIAARAEAGAIIENLRPSGPIDRPLVFVVHDSENMDRAVIVNLSALAFATYTPEREETPMVRDPFTVTKRAELVAVFTGAGGTFNTWHGSTAEELYDAILREAVKLGEPPAVFLDDDPRFAVTDKIAAENRAAAAAEPVPREGGTP